MGKRDVNFCGADRHNAFCPGRKTAKGYKHTTFRAAVVIITTGITPTWPKKYSLHMRNR